MPVQTAGLADLNDLADLRRLHSPGLGAVHLQGLVAAPAVVVGEVVFEDPPQMPLAQNHDVVEAFATDAADHPLDVGRLPGTPRRDDHLLDAHRRDAPAEVGAVDAISVSQQKPRGRASTTCWPVHRAVGFVVMLKCTTLRRSWARMIKTKSTLNRTVETVKKSSDTSSLTWLARNARHVGDGGLRGRTLYFSTVDLATSMPSFRSSLRMRGDPQAGLDSDIFRMRSRTSLAMAGRPGLPARLSRVQWSRNRLRCQEMTVLGFTKTRAPCQPDHARDSHTQSRRSAGFSRGRRPPSWRTAS